MSVPYEELFTTLALLSPRAIFHAALHVLLPLVAAQLFYREQRRRVALLMLCGILIDLDHLWATPIFDPNRCSIGFHPLHTMPAMILYALLLLNSRFRILGLGLVIHIALDVLDCYWMKYL